MLNFLFPPQDLNIKSIGENITNTSKKTFKIHNEICYKCKKSSKNFKTHLKCKKYLEKVVTCFYYTQSLKTFILGLKYLHYKQLGNDITKIIKNFYLMYLPITNTALTFIPMHRIRKYFVKGYNQSELLAKYLANQLNLPLIKVCKKIKNNKPQTKTNSKKERLNNIKNTFSINKVNLNNIDNIVIIDDIITTGSTLEELAKCIKTQYPNIKIYGLTVARK